MDNLNRLWRQFESMLLNNKGFLRINRDPDPPEPPATGSPPANDPPATDPPANDPPPPDPNANPFFDGLSEENRGVNKDNVATLSKFKSADDLAKSYIELETKVGEKGIIVPDANATPEVKEKFLNDLGRPATPAEYKLEAVEGLHESITINDETKTHFNNEMHKQGITNDQANAINKMQLDFVDRALKAQDATELKATQDAETALRAEWKENYDVKSAEVKRIIEKIGGQELINAHGEKGNDPIIVKAWSIVAGMLSEDQINSIRSPIGPEGGNETSEEAKSRIAEIEKVGSDDYKALMDPENVNHKKVVEERSRLFQKAYPTGGA